MERLAPMDPAVLRKSVLFLVSALGAAAVVFVVLAALPSIGRGLGMTDVRTTTRMSPKHESAKTISRDALDAPSRSLFPDDDDDVAGASELAVVRARTSIFAQPGKQRVGMIEQGTAVLIVGEKGSYYRVIVMGEESRLPGWIDKKSVRVR
ncbi:MAG: hypothetical protein U0414_31135 [Polyangiaceae bacterium]